MTRVCVNGPQCRELQVRFGEVMRRVIEGTLTFKPTAEALQKIIEGEHEIGKQQAQGSDMVLCQAFSGCRCTICGGYFGDSALDVVCPSGHVIGQYYPHGR